jgi:hypothetical protein
MSGLIDEITRRLPDRWLATTLAPGALWLAVAALAFRLGHTHALDWDAGRDAVRAVADQIRDRPADLVPYGLLALGAAVLASGAARLLGGGLRELWLGRWPGPLAGAADRLTRRREARARAVLASRGTALPAVYLPRTPTWIGDRVRLADARVDAQYGLSLALIWPRLWQLVDDATRQLVQQARARFESACTSGGWAGCYAVLALLWWPVAVLAAVLLALSWRHGRLAAGVFADTLESTVDLHYRELAQALGHQIAPGPGLAPAVADAVNDQLHKGATPQPQADRPATELIR